MTFMPMSRRMEAAVLFPEPMPPVRTSRRRPVRMAPDGTLPPMEYPVPRWQVRAHRILVGTEWVALVVGIVAGVVNSSGSPASLAAAGAGAVWVLLATATPPVQFRRPYVPEVIALTGVVATMASVTLTGAADSPYLLLAMTPALHLTLLGGNRVGIGTGMLATVLLVVVSLAQDQAFGQVAGPAITLAVVTLVVAQIRRLLVEIDARASALENTTLESQARLAHLEQTRDLIDRLVASASDGQLSVPALGATALDTVAHRYPEGMTGIVTVASARGPVIVASMGKLQPDADMTELPLVAGGAAVASITVQPAIPDGDRDEVTEALKPLALAISNGLRLQELAVKAVSEERLRLARELHDEIGPSLASLGLSLDVAMLEAGAEVGLVDHLQQLRDTVTRLVDDVRTTVADLREPASPSLTHRLEASVTDLPTDPPIKVSLDERRPARPSIAPQIHAIVIESVRNALHHSQASAVRIHGWIDYDRGRIVVEDDGTGFDPESLPEGHWGISGMKERAHRAGLDLDLTTGPEGTRVVLEWGPQ